MHTQTHTHIDTHTGMHIKLTAWLLTPSPKWTLTYITAGRIYVSFSVWQRPRYLSSYGLKTKWNMVDKMSNTGPDVVNKQNRKIWTKRKKQTFSYVNVTESWRETLASDSNGIRWHMRPKFRHQRSGLLSCVTLLLSNNKDGDIYVLYVKSY